MLKAGTIIDSPMLWNHGTGAWRGRLGEAFHLDPIGMTLQLVAAYETWDVRSHSPINDEPRSNEDLLRALSEAGASDLWVAQQLFEDSNVEVIHPRRRLHWTTTERPQPTSSETGVYIAEDWRAATVRASVTVDVWNDEAEEWLPEDGDWEILPASADWEAPEDYQRAEDALLSRLDLTRDDLTDETDVPGSWM